MFHAFEVHPDNTRTRREDLPDFEEPQEVANYLTNNAHVSNRAGVRIRLDWIECDHTCPEAHNTRGQNGNPSH